MLFPWSVHAHASLPCPGSSPGVGVTYSPRRLGSDSPLPRRVFVSCPPGLPSPLSPPAGQAHVPRPRVRTPAVPACPRMCLCSADWRRRVSGALRGARFLAFGGLAAVCEKAVSPPPVVPGQFVRSGRFPGGHRGFCREPQHRHCHCRPDPLRAARSTPWGVWKAPRAGVGGRLSRWPRG